MNISKKLFEVGDCFYYTADKPINITSNFLSEKITLKKGDHFLVLANDSLLTYDKQEYYELFVLTPHGTGTLYAEKVDEPTWCRLC